MSKPACGGAPRGGDEIGRDAVHVGARHLARQLRVRAVGNRRGRHQRPVAFRPAVRRRAASRAACCPCARRGRAGCPSSRRCARARSRRCAARRRAGASFHRPAQPGVMRASGLTQVISVYSSPAPPSARAPKCTRWKSLGRPSVAEYIAIGETTTRLGTVMPRSVYGVNIGLGGCASSATVDARAGLGGHTLEGAPGKPALVAFQPGGVAQAQVLVADALAAREHAVHELLGRQLVAVARADDLEPLHRIPGRVLQPQHVDLARGLVSGQHAGDVAAPSRLEQPRQLDRVLERQLGARADGEVRRVHRVAHQHDVAAAVEVVPLPAAHALEIDPRRTALQGVEVARVAQQPVALQVLREELLAEVDRLLDVRLVQAVRLPHVLRRLDDEGRGAVVELVDMGLEPAVLGLLEQEVEGVEEPRRAEPDEAVGPRHDVGLEDLGIFLPDARIDAVAGDHEVGVGVVGVRIRLGLEHQFHAQRLAAPLQDVEQLLAPDADEAVAAAADAAALEVQLDVVPVVERDLDGVGRLGVPGRMLSIVASEKTTPQPKVS